MPRFSANLSWLFQDLDFLDRFQAAKAAGFEAIEFLFPYEFEKDLIKAQLDRHGLKLALFNCPAGDWAAGDRGLAIDASRRDEFEASLEKALDYATTLNCQNLHCLAGVFPDEGDPFEIEATYVSNLKTATQAAKRAGITILIEPINSKDMPGYYLNYAEQAASVIEKVGADNLKMQFDIYHQQRMEGEIIRTFETFKDIIGHIQIADNPGRHEPGTGEINFANIFRTLDEARYNGYIGCELVLKEMSEAELLISIDRLG